MSDQVGGPRPSGDVTYAQAVARQMFDRIADKWALLVVYRLGEGRLRFSELHSRIEGISHKMLTQTLRGLERDGVLTRHVFPTSPPSVEYALTEPGRELLEAVSVICRWTERHLPHIESARLGFDAAHQPGLTSP
ncbi:winged helix-turn-helix transcriptional regulator [Amycolatopsis rhizosphaerae]|uniref:winged helix-turn-helix transcriptional regulator n=1 Tax=Amycolatopsis rhizosphaerae TaxID=2053003 RepID=UPI003CCC55C9